MREDRPWTIEAVQLLIRLAREGCPVPQICVTLGRPEPAVRGKLAQLGVTPSHAAKDVRDYAS